MYKSLTMRAFCNQCAPIAVKKFDVEEHRQHKVKVNKMSKRLLAALFSVLLISCTKTD